MFDLLIFVGKIKKNTARVYFLWGKQKALITKSRQPTRRAPVAQNLFKKS